jgi:hypothetical protein
MNTWVAAFGQEKLSFRMIQPVRYLLTSPACINQPILFAASTGLPEFNEAAMAQLQGMGFPVIRCQKALLATGNSDSEAAMEWLFGHMEDPGTCPFLLSFLLTIERPFRY